MPIQELTTTARAVFPSLGTLRKGGPKESNRPGPDLTYFRFVGTTPEVQAAFDAAYGKQPRAIEVYLPHATVDGVFSAWQEEWVKSSLVHRCDGQMMVRWRDGSRIVDGSKPCPYHSGAKERASDKDGCQPVARMICILPKLLLAGHVGFVTLLTTAKNDIVSLYGSLLSAAAMRGKHTDGLQGIKWLLCREEVEISTPTKDGARARRKKWLVRIRPAADWMQHMIETARVEALGGLVPQLAPISGTPVDQLTGEIAPSDDDPNVIDGESREVDGDAAGDSRTSADYCDPPAFLDDDAKRQAIVDRLVARGLPPTEAEAVVDAWRRRCLAREDVVKAFDALVAARGGHKAAPPADHPAPPPADTPATTTPPTDGAADATLAPTAAPDTPPTPQPPATEAKAAPAAAPRQQARRNGPTFGSQGEADAYAQHGPIDDGGEQAEPQRPATAPEPDWVAGMRERFKAAGIGSGITDACLGLWTLQRMSGQQAFIEFGKVKKDAAKDPAGQLDYYTSRLREATAAAEAQAAEVVEPTPF